MQRYCASFFRSQLGTTRSPIIAAVSHTIRSRAVEKRLISFLRGVDLISMDTWYLVVFIVEDDVSILNRINFLTILHDTLTLSYVVLLDSIVLGENRMLLLSVVVYSKSL